MSDEELQEWSKEHLHYELQMLFDTADILLKKPFPLSQIFRNACIESFVIHFRNLTEFFFPKNARDDDVTAFFFFKQRTKWDYREPASFSDLRIRANKEVGHMTMTRKAGISAGKEWPVEEIVKDIRKISKEFCSKASHSRLDESIGGLLES